MPDESSRQPSRKKAAKKTATAKPADASKSSRTAKKAAPEKKPEAAQKKTAAVKKTTTKKRPSGPIVDKATHSPIAKEKPGGRPPTRTSEAELFERETVRKTVKTPFEQEDDSTSKAPFEIPEEVYKHETEAEQHEAQSIPADTAPEHHEPGVPPHQVFMRPDIPGMYIIHIAPEMAPVAKVGGLADVVFGLSRELEIRGNTVEIILPKFDCMRCDHIWGLTRVFDDLWVPWHDGAIHCSVYFGFVHGRKCFFIEPHSQDNFFNRGKFYGDKDDVDRFAFFSRAAVEFMHQSGKHPEIIHCHDWQTGLVPVYLFEIYKFLGMTHPRVCYTIHNFRHQGVTGHQLLRASGLHRPDYYAQHERLLDNHHPQALNLMKGGIVYSNFVTTVSPRHAGEARDQGQGFGLEPTLQNHSVKYGGVLNGIDYDAWNPESDGHIPVHYDVNSIDKKYDNKRALRERLWLADNEKPIVGFVGRLDPQKGLDLVRHALFYAINHGAQFVLLGSSPEASINDYFWQLKHYLNDNQDCHIEVGFNMELAHIIYAGSDMMVVPSRFEPCGLTQLISMRYGTIPVVRSVGGLADTVFDKDFSDKPLDQRNGYVFHNADYPGIESALSRAIACYYQYPEHFRNLIENAMHTDYSWNVPAQHYLNIYDFIREK